jgi:hypothetical protein
MLTAWKGSMQNPSATAVANAFLCPSLQTARDYVKQIENAGLRILGCEDIAGKVIRTWKICLERVRKLRALIYILPREVRRFVDGIGTILKAYCSGDLTYSVIVAEK